MISPDLIIMAVSALGGFLAQRDVNKQADNHNQMMGAMGSVEEAKKGGTSDKTIRFITSLTLLGLLSFVMVGPAFLDTHVTLVEQGWLWTTTTEIKGIIYDDNFRQMLMAMTFFYLGRAPAVR